MNPNILDNHETDCEVKEIRELNKEEAIKVETKFYDDAKSYWSEIPSTVEGMLGGFGFISHTDIQGSKTFLEKLFSSKARPGKTYALDCGAGIGRVSKHLLIPIFDCVDLVEQNAQFLCDAKNYIGSCNKVGEYFPTGLQNFVPEPQKYDVIWCQWVLGHLKDDDFIKFFKDCITGLKENGVIIIKENTTSSGRVEIDEQDSSVTRPLILLQKLLKNAGLRSIREHMQTNFPKGLYPVQMIALRPA